MAAFFKCKMCGGDLNIDPNDTIATCEYCGTTQTIPFIDSDKKTRLFNRANEYRLNNEFDKAYNAYETIVLEEPLEAEAYWGLVLSEYGVEYVQDPNSKKRIPTCHRTKLSSILSNKNYLKAIEIASGENKMMYEDEASLIDSLQKRIISISSKEVPYDVFICYKESDANSNRTKDSVLAQDIYDNLTRSGLRVFFSRISLEDKLGKDYEPFIFNALNTAKVLLLVTTSNDNCNAVWVKNEWKRYLDFMKTSTDKTIIPVIQDMSPYELPDELQKLQVLDMSKLGAMQDLTRGVNKIVGNTKDNNTGFSSQEKELLNQLKRNDEKSRKLKKFLLICVTVFAGFFAYVLMWQGASQDIYFDVYKYDNKVKSLSLLTLCSLPLAVGIILNILKGTKNKISQYCYLGSMFAIFVTSFMAFYVGIRMSWFYYLCNSIVLIFLIAFTILGNKNNKKDTIIFICLGVLLFVGSIIPMFISRDTKRDINKEQIFISNYANVYETPDYKADRYIAKVYDGELYDVISEVADGIYKIKLNNGVGVEGYISEEAVIQDSNKQSRIFIIPKGTKGNLFINTEYINVRATKSFEGKILGKVYRGEIYDGELINSSDYWYQIDYKGSKAYVWGGWENSEKYIIEINY